MKLAQSELKEYSFYCRIKSGTSTFLFLEYFLYQPGLPTLLQCYLDFPVCYGAIIFGPHPLHNDSMHSCGDASRIVGNLSLYPSIP